MLWNEHIIFLVTFPLFFVTKMNASLHGYCEDFYFRVSTVQEMCGKSENFVLSLEK